MNTIEKHFVEKIIEKIFTKKLIVFGTGSLCDNLLMLNMPSPDLFIDNDVKKVGKYKKNIKIQSPDFILSMNKKDIFIIVASSYYNEISDQLFQFGLIENYHYINGEIIYEYLLLFEKEKNLRRINISLSKGVLAKRDDVSAYDTRSWEYSVFSQNNEDGIIEHLLSKIYKDRNNYFIEIGASNGVENNSSFLAIVKKYSGIMIEGVGIFSRQCAQLMNDFNIGVECKNLFVKKGNIGRIKEWSIYENPDFFSIDIDGNDYYILKELLELGLEPKVICVEYNSAYGPDKALTIVYNDDFQLDNTYQSQLYYGASIKAWINLLERHGYKFITVESNGVNAFFIKEKYFLSQDFINIKNIPFEENFFQLRLYKGNWKEQFQLIKDREFFEC